MDKYPVVNSSTDCKNTSDIYTSTRPFFWLPLIVIFTLSMLYIIIIITMLSAKKASEMIKTMPMEDRLEALKDKVSLKTKNALDQKIRETIASFENEIAITLKSDICTDPDENIRGLLKALGYEDVKITSDFPGYSESYVWTTTIKFKIPR